MNEKKVIAEGKDFQLVREVGPFGKYILEVSSDSYDPGLHFVASPTNIELWLDKEIIKAIRKSEG